MSEDEQRQWKCVKILVNDIVLNVAFNVKNNLVRVRSNGMYPTELLAKDCIDGEIPYAIVKPDKYLKK